MTTHTLPDDADTEPVTIQDLDTGDLVLWNDRQVPLTVTPRELHIPDGTDRDAVVVTNNRQRDGATYLLIEATGRKADPKVRKEVPVSARNPRGHTAYGSARDLRRVVIDE